ncbi:Oidioi.mRNA.OKI2018_I69.chr1.g474.t1.cds [Oikopleura dioica]|uniref:Oidioi.mRNA.OKI2018_I69.chr1.g474.t1.cds n=1 Tax=Oikopleura dioica TaxID=34765 RepID=A0ABN7SNU4_OIKDI|nr:Oidioi.mRNA.OKI2018_I69.chr1.g474.t1.cds [Oikopleura dioica]
MMSKLEDATDLMGELIDLVSDKTYGDSFASFVFKTGQVSQLIEALALEIKDQAGAKDWMGKVKEHWGIVQKSVSQIDSSDSANENPCTIQELFQQRSPAAVEAMKEAKKEMDRVRQEIEDFFANKYKTDKSFHEDQFSPSYSSDSANENPCTIQELFQQRSPAAVEAMKEAKKEMDRVRQEIEDFFANKTTNSIKFSVGRRVNEGLYNLRRFF